MRIKLTESQLKRLKQHIIKEEYPLGTDNDSQAPWNQTDEPRPENTDIEIVDDDVVKFEDVLVIFKSDRGGEFEMTLEDLLNGGDLSRNDIKFFNQAIRVFPRPEEFKRRIQAIADKFEKTNYIEYEGDSEYEPYGEDDQIDYRDEM